MTPPVPICQQIPHIITAPTSSALLLQQYYNMIFVHFLYTVYSPRRSATLLARCLACIFVPLALCWLPASVAQHASRYRLLALLLGRIRDIASTALQRATNAACQAIDEMQAVGVTTVPPRASAPPRKSRLRNRFATAEDDSRRLSIIHAAEENPQGVDRRSICEEILAGGHVQTFVDFFYLTHRPGPAQGEQGYIVLLVALLGALFFMTSGHCRTGILNHIFFHNAYIHEVRRAWGAHQNGI